MKTFVTKKICHYADPATKVLSIGHWEDEKEKFWINFPPGELRIFKDGFLLETNYGTIFIKFSSLLTEALPGLPNAEVFYKVVKVTRETKEESSADLEKAGGQS